MLRTAGMCGWLVLVSGPTGEPIEPQTYHRFNCCPACQGVIYATGQVDLYFGCTGLLRTLHTP